MTPIDIAIALLGLGVQFVQAAEKVKEIAKQNMAMTDEQWASYDTARDAMYDREEWQPEPDPGT